MMLKLTRVGCATALCAVLLSAQGAIAGDPPRSLPLDTATTVNGVEVACTGIGQTKLDPRWLAFPVRVEFSDSHDYHLTDEAASIFDAAGQLVLSVQCEAPWILLKLKPGAYRVEGRLIDSPAKPRSAPFTPPAKGQMRLILKFPDV